MLDFLSCNTYFAYVILSDIVSFNYTAESIITSIT